MKRSILHAGMEDSVPEPANKGCGVDAPPVQVARIEIEPERRMMTRCLEHPLGSQPVVRDARRVALVRESDRVGFEFVKNRLPRRRERAEARLDRGFVARRETVKQVADRRAH